MQDGAGALIDAVQFADEPPFAPAHVQFHGPAPVKPGRLPSAHKLEVGALAKLCAFEVPHIPGVGVTAAGHAASATHEQLSPVIPPQYRVVQFSRSPAAQLIVFAIVSGAEGAGQLKQSS